MRRRKGFTLAETLIVVAIIVVLGALSAIVVTNYQRRMKQLEMDSAAKELFLAAQNHLSVAYSQGYLGKMVNADPAAGAALTDCFGHKEKIDIGDDDVYYFIVGGDTEDYDSRSENASLLSSLLPFAALDETVLSQGSYIIRYNRSSGLILDVFYVNKDDSRFGGCFTATRAEYDDLMTNWRGEENAEKRRRYGETNAVIGYYGGVEDDYGVIRGTGTLSEPSFVVNNGNVLSLTIIDGNQVDTNLREISLKLVMKGLSSGTQKEYILLDKGGRSEKAPVGFTWTAGNTGTLVLDSLNDRHLHFSAMFESDGFLPGENLELKLVSFSEGTLTNRAESGLQTTNSLFADYDDSHTVKIGNFRHLENLSAEVSAFAQETLAVNCAEQITDLYWNDYISGVADGIWPISGDKTPQYYFRPVQTVQPITYLGRSHQISDVAIAETGTQAAGLFRNLYGSSVRNLELVDFAVSSEHGNAGALAGTVSGGSLYGILVRNSSGAFYDTEKIVGTNEEILAEIRGFNAGGLAGKVTDSTVDCCAASVYVKGVANSASIEDASAAGGLIGAAEGNCSITNSYSGGHTSRARYQDISDGEGHINVISAGWAGGLIGWANLYNDSEISCCYSTCSVNSTQMYAGGLIGEFDQGKVKDCYCTGRVSGPGACGYFIGLYWGTAEFEGDNYYLTNITVLKKAEAQIEDQRLNDTTSSYMYHVMPVSAAEAAENGLIVERAEDAVTTAYAYDHTLSIDYGGNYYFKTVRELNPNAPDVPFISVHYGDWQIPQMASLTHTVKNEDTLSLVVYASDERLQGMRSVAVAVLGEESDNVRLFRLNLEQVTPDATYPTGLKVTMAGYGYAMNGAATWIEITDINDPSVPDAIRHLEPVVEEDAGNYLITVIFDDITQTDKHFDQLFCSFTSGGNLLAGENIHVYASSSDKMNADISWAELYAGEWVPSNSLYAYEKDFTPVLDANGTNNKTFLKNVRHLENLDARISNVGVKTVSGMTLTFQEAEMIDDISWSDFYTLIYPVGLTTEVGGFLSLHAPNLRLFNGGNFTISSLPIQTVSNAITTWEPNSSGLFAAIDSELTVENVKLQDFDVKGSAAGYLAGKLRNGADLTVDGVLAISAEEVVVGSQFAGGLIGVIESGASADIRNSAAALMVSSTGAAGGLVGAVDGGTLAIAESYVGGHVNDDNDLNNDQQGRFDMNSAAGCNIVGGTEAGGLVGGVQRGSSVQITKSFCAASVAGTGGYAGGLVGEVVGDSLRLNTVYCIAPVYGAATGQSTVGALIGYGDTALSHASSLYYLPELYHGSSLSDVLVEGTSSAAHLTAHSAYYAAAPAESETEVNSIAGTVRAADGTYPTLIYKTFPFANCMTRGTTEGVREFPYSIWTHFDFDLNGFTGNVGRPPYFGTYYGDWEVAAVVPTVMHSVSFYYTLGATEDRISFENTALEAQKMIEDFGNTIILPSKRITGYQLTGWDIYNLAGNRVMTVGATDVVNLEARYCNSNLTFVARYAEDGNYSLTFYTNYDAYSGSFTGPWVRKGNPITIAGSTPINSLLLTPYIENLEDYNFECWCSNEELTDMLPTTDTTTVAEWSLFSGGTKEIKVYPRYRLANYYPINIDFYYTLTRDATELKDFYLVNGFPRYELQCRMGDDFTETVDLPAYEGYELLMVENRDSSVTSGSPAVGSWGISGNGISINLKSQYVADNNGANFYVIYLLNIPDVSGQVNYKLHLHYDHARNSDLEYSDTDEYVRQITGSDMVNRMPNVTIPDAPEGYRLGAIQVSALTSNPDANNFHVYYERQTYELAFDSRGGSFDYDTMEFYWGQPVNLFTLQPWVDWTAGRLTKVGNSFGGWKVYEKGYEDDEHRITATSFPMEKRNLEAVATWNPGMTTYRVSYWYQNIAGDGWLYMGSSGNLAVTSGTTINPNTNSPYTYLGSSVPAAITKDKAHFTLNTELSRPVVAASDGTTVLNLYFDRNIYTITFTIARDHVHTLSCYAIDQHVMITDATISHTHDASCYEGLGTRIVEDVLYHDHTCECWGLDPTMRPVLVTNPHISHISDCYDRTLGGAMTSGNNPHTHGLSCYEAGPEEIVSNYSCGVGANHSVTIDGTQYALDFRESSYPTEYKVYEVQATTGAAISARTYLKMVKIDGHYYVYHGDLEDGQTVSMTGCPWPIGAYDQVEVDGATYVVSNLDRSAAESVISCCDWEWQEGHRPGKMVKLNGTWYAYTGTAAVGTVITPSCRHWCQESEYYQLELNGRTYHCDQLIDFITNGTGYRDELRVFVMQMTNVENQSDVRNGKFVFYDGDWYYYDGPAEAGEILTRDCAWFTGDYMKLVLDGVTYRVDGLTNNQLQVTEVLLTDIDDQRATRTAYAVKYGSDYYYYTGSVPRGGIVPSSCEYWFTGSYKSMTIDGTTYKVSDLTADSLAVNKRVYRVFLKNVVDQNDYRYVKVMPWITTGDDGSRVVDWYLYTGEEAAGTTAPAAEGHCSNIKGHLSARYEANIAEPFDILSDSDKWGTSYHEFAGRYVTTLDVMPGGDVTFWRRGVYGSNNQLQYLVEVTETEAAANQYDAVAKLSYPFSTTPHYFKIYHLVKYQLGSMYLTDAEEFHTIAGYTKWGYSYNNLITRGTFKDYSTINRYNGGFGTNQANVTFFYLRNTYDLTIRISSEDEYGTRSTTDHVVPGVQFEAYLKDHHLNGGTLGYYEGAAATDPHDGSVYHLYYDETHSQLITPEEFETIQMPAGGMMLFGYWNPPQYEVSFYSDYDETTGTYGPACDIDPLQVTRGRSLDDVMTDHGRLLDAYKPTAVGKTFFDWYYWDSTANTARRFHTGDAIRGNMRLYAKWNELYASGRTVEIEVLHIDADTGEVLERMERSPYLITGRPELFYAKTFEGYFPETMAQAVLITEDTESVVFRYYKQSDWHYSVEYYIRLNSAGDGSNYAAGSYTLPTPIKVERGRAVNLKDEVWFEMPAGYEKYSYLGYEFSHFDEASNTMTIESGNSGRVEIYPTSLTPDANGSQAVIRFYLTLDLNSLDIEDAYITYDGQAHNTAVKEDHTVSTLPTGWKVMMYYVSTENAVNAGAYTANVTAAVTVPGQSLPYLLDSTTSMIRILPINLTVASEGGRILYNPNEVELLLRNDPNTNIRVQNVPLGEVKLPENNGRYFAPNEGIDVFFAVDAFRVEKGLMPNSFTYKLYRMENGRKVYANDTNGIAGNYVIQTVFGQLVVE